MCNNKTNYVGNKNINGVYQSIINLIPECSVFCEAFAGSAQLSYILSSIVPGCKYFLNDINKSIIDNYAFTSATKFNLDAISFMSYIVNNYYNSSVIFLDPPYHHDSRPNNKSLYEYEMSDMDHIALLNYISGSTLKIILIHPINCIYDSLIDLGWCYKDIRIRYNNKTSNERIYFNYHIPDKLLTYTFIGDNFTDRQRIKRKIDKLTNKLLLLPVRERNALIAHIHNKFK